MNRGISLASRWRSIVGVLFLVVAIVGVHLTFLSPQSGVVPVTKSPSPGNAPFSSGASSIASMQSSSTEHEEGGWVARAERAERWPIPAPLRLPGGPVDVVLASSPEEWLLKLPSSKQPAARAFLDRNAEAYAFSTKAEQAWLIENGFPSLEEAAYFSSLPRSQTCEKSIDDIRLGLLKPCLNPKMAALSSDAYLHRIANKVGILGAGSSAVQISGSLVVAPAAAEAIFLKAEAEGLLGHNAVGAYRFYQLARLERELGPLSGGAGRSYVALALAYSCEGDARVAGERRPEIWANPSAQGAQFAVQLLGSDLRRSSGTPVCGFGGKAFPPDDR